MDSNMDLKQFDYISKYINRLISKNLRLVREITKDQVYIYPAFHKKIQSKLESFPSEDIVCIKGVNSVSEDEYRKILKDPSDPRKYHILTHLREDSSEEPVQYLVTKRVGELISAMMDVYREEQFKIHNQKSEIERLKNPNFENNFDEVNAELRLSGYEPLRFSKMKYAQTICKVLFKNKQSIQNIWAIDELSDVLKKIYQRDGREEPKNMNKAVELKIRRINERVKTFTNGSVDNLIRCYDYQVYVDPKYFHLFK